MSFFSLSEVRWWQWPSCIFCCGCDCNTVFRVLLKINLHSFVAVGGFIAVIYEFLELNRHFALKMCYVLQCVCGPRRCEIRRWLLLDSIQYRRLPQSLRLYCRLWAQVFTAWTNRPIHNSWTASPVTSCLCCPWHTGDREVAYGSRRPSIAVSSKWKRGHYRNIENH
jgi:hypothetical protein